MFTLVVASLKLTEVTVFQISLRLPRNTPPSSCPLRCRCRRRGRDSATSPIHLSTPVCSGWAPSHAALLRLISTAPEFGSAVAPPCRSPPVRRARCWVRRSDLVRRLGLGEGAGRSEEHAGVMPVAGDLTGDELCCRPAGQAAACACWAGFGLGLPSVRVLGWACGGPSGRCRPGLRKEICFLFFFLKMWILQFLV
jgi:hypothetical protein